MTDVDPGENLAFLRAVHEEVLAWYRSAESKGQILLSIDGVIVTVLAGLVFGDPTGAGARAEVFTGPTWALLGTAGFALLGSLLSAVMCLRSRLRGTPEQAGAGWVWWFGGLARMDPARAGDMLLAADRRFECEALASQLPVLSRNVLAKHRWVNRGWGLTALALASLVGSAASYLIRL